MSVAGPVGGGRMGVAPLSFSIVVLAVAGPVAVVPEVAVGVPVVSVAVAGRGGRARGAASREGCRVARVQGVPALVVPGAGFWLPDITTEGRGGAGFAVGRGALLATPGLVAVVWVGPSWVPFVVSSGFGATRGLRLVVSPVGAERRGVEWRRVPGVGRWWWHVADVFVAVVPAVDALEGVFFASLSRGQCW
jgi:hypothetical protein